MSQALPKSCQRLHYKSTFKVSGIGLISLVGYKLITNKPFTKTQLKMVSMYTAFNEFYFYYYDKVFIKNKPFPKSVIFAATWFYASPLLWLSIDDKYLNYAKYTYAAIFIMKCMVGLPWIKRLKLDTMSDCTTFVGFGCAITYGLITRQLFTKSI